MMLRQLDVQSKPDVFPRPVVEFEVAGPIVVVIVWVIPRVVVLVHVFNGLARIPDCPLRVVKIWPRGGGVGRDAHAPAFIQQKWRAKLAGVEDQFSWGLSFRNMTMRAIWPEAKIDMGSPATWG